MQYRLQQLLPLYQKSTLMQCQTAISAWIPEASLNSLGMAAPSASRCLTWYVKIGRSKGGTVTHKQLPFTKACTLPCGLPPNQDNTLYQLKSLTQCYSQQRLYKSLHWTLILAMSMHCIAANASPSIWTYSTPREYRTPCPSLIITNVPVELLGGGPPVP